MKRTVISIAAVLTLRSISAAIDFDGAAQAVKQPMKECGDHSAIVWGTIIPCYFNFDEPKARPTPPEVETAKDAKAPAQKRIDAIKKLEEDGLKGKDRDCVIALFDRLRKGEPDDTPVRSALQQAIRSVTKSSYKMMDPSCPKWGAP